MAPRGTIRILVVKGFQRWEDTDFTKISFLIVMLITIRSVLSIVIHLEQLDVKSAFLHGNLRTFI